VKLSSFICIFRPYSYQALQRKNCLIFLFFKSVLRYARFESPPGLHGGLTKQKRPSPRGLLVQVSRRGSAFLYGPHFAKKSRNGDLYSVSTSQMRGAALMGLRSVLHRIIANVRITGLFSRTIGPFQHIKQILAGLAYHHTRHTRTHLKRTNYIIVIFA